MIIANHAFSLSFLSYHMSKKVKKEKVECFHAWFKEEIKLYLSIKKIQIEGTCTVHEDDLKDKQKEKTDKQQIIFDLSKQTTGTWSIIYNLKIPKPEKLIIVQRRFYIILGKTNIYLPTRGHEAASINSEEKGKEKQLMTSEREGGKGKEGSCSPPLSAAVLSARKNVLDCLYAGFMCEFTL
jgi:hypothetical protein